MTVFLLAVAGVAGTVAGRAAYGTWFNHVSHYSAIWGASLILFEMRLIEYYPLRLETWTFIGLAWLAFMVGALVVTLGGNGGLRAGERHRGNTTLTIDEFRLRRVIVVLAAISGLGVLLHWVALLERFGTVTNVLTLGNVVYALSRSEGFTMGLPYLDSFSLPASLFGGLLLAVRRKFSMLAVLPVLITIAEGLGLMGRMKMLMAVILFVSGYLLAVRSPGAPVLSSPMAAIRKWGTIGIAVLLFAASVEVIRSNRGSIETIPGAGSALRSLRGASFLTPSLYLYLTVDHGVFNQYLRQGGEREVPGANTFAPLYRALSKLGFDLPVREYQRFYSTPASANTGSYLREVHADFGAAGVLAVPFVVGLLCSRYWNTSLRPGGIVQLVALAHLIVLVDVSFIVMASRTGYWMLSLITGLAGAAYIGGGWRMDR